MRHTKKLLKNTVELNRQKQMIRLLERYALQVYEPGTWILPYVWQFGYVDLQQPGEIQHQEFICHTNNMVFAVAIFEAQQLTQGHRVTVCQAQYNIVL